MGFFSAECVECHKSVVAPYKLTPIMQWMNECTIIKPDGTFIQGAYNGYGAVEGTDDDYWGPEEDRPDAEVVFGDYVDNTYAKVVATVWHTACWRRAGEPREHRGPSATAEDQGFFFEQSDYEIHEPQGLLNG